MKASVRVEGVGLVGPGIASWTAAREMLAGRAPYVAAPTVLPVPQALPPTERRRAGKSVRIALSAGIDAAADAGREPRDFAAIFCASTGDGETLHAICEALASDDREISPTRFHNSVHNAPSGYWGIATGAMHAADSIAAYDGTFAAGVLEGVARIITAPPTPVLVIAYDAPYPEPLHAKRPVADSFAVALALGGANGRGPRISVEPSSAAPTLIANPALEAVRRDIPAARSLPLLQLLAAGTPGRVVLEYLDGMALAVEVHP